MSVISTIERPSQMVAAYASLAKDLLAAEPFDRGSVHAQKTTTAEMVTRELRNVTMYFNIGGRDIGRWQDLIRPNLPWAENHFQERVGGVPLNPPPEEANWPFAQRGNAIHKKDEKFSHTYPERFWPKEAGDMDLEEDARRGIRFYYGDLADLVLLLKENPRSRQAYLPVWFPEDLTAAVEGERVPCTLGYHFMVTPDQKLDCMYPMRSCDFIRFFRDDIYMAGRLMQWIGEQIKVDAGVLTMHIANLHAFVGDQMFLEGVAQVPDPRSQYDFGAML